MLPTDYFLFLQIAFFLTITPGTPRVVIVTYAINYGLKRSVITAAGRCFCQHIANDSRCLWSWML